MIAGTRTDSRRATAVVTAVAFAAMSVSLTGLGIPTAQAAPPGQDKRVALYLFPKARFPAAEAALLEAIIRPQLEQLVRVRSAGPSGEPPRSLKSLVGSSVDNGFRALNDRNAGLALDHFEKAHGIATAWEGLMDKRLLARIMKGYGAARIMLGDVGAGQELIEASLNLIPDQQISEYGWTLDLRTAFNELQERRSGLEPGSLDIDVLPEGAVVRVGGELKGFAPLEVEGLSPGPHWVETSADGYRWQGMFVEVMPGTSAIHAAELVPLARASELEAAKGKVSRLMARSTPKAQLEELKSITDSDAVIALEVSSTGTAYIFEGYVLDGAAPPRKLQVQFPRDGTFVSRVRAYLAETLGTSEVADDSFLALDGPPQTSVMAAGELVIDPDDPIFKSDSGQDDSSITDAWWFWVIVGGVTAGLVAGGIALFGGAGEGTGPTGRMVLNVNTIR